APLRRRAAPSGRLARALVLAQDLGRVLGDLGQLGLELADLARSPDRRAEPVVGDRGHHQKSRVSRVNALIQPVSSLHAISLPSPSQERRLIKMTAPADAAHSAQPKRLSGQGQLPARRRAAASPSRGVTFESRYNIPAGPVLFFP